MAKSTMASSSKQKDPKVSAPKKSASQISSSDSEGSDSSGDEDSDSVDSEGDIEAVTPKKKQTQTVTGGSSSGRSLSKYVPPLGMIPANVDASFKDSPFEYSRLQNSKNLQLWAIRVPLDFKSSRLTSLTLTASTSNSKPSGSLKVKSTTYKLAPAAEASTSKIVVDSEGRQPTAGASAADSMGTTAKTDRLVGGEEMASGMRLLVPDLNKGGKLVVAPIQISQRLLLTPDPLEGRENMDESVGASSSYLPDLVPTQTEIARSSKRPQPEHLFKFRNRAFGFDTPGPGATQMQSMEVDKETVTTPVAADKKKSKRKNEGQDGQSSSKQKKSKA